MVKSECVFRICVFVNEKRIQIFTTASCFIFVWIESYPKKLYSVNTIYLFFWVYLFTLCKNGLLRHLLFEWFYGNAVAFAVNSENACSRQCFSSAYVTIKIDCSSLDTSWTYGGKTKWVRWYYYHESDLFWIVTLLFPKCQHLIYSSIGQYERDPTTVFRLHSPNEINSPWTI